MTARPDPADAPRRVRSQVVPRAILRVALVAVIAFWVLLLVDDDGGSSISPFATIRVPTKLLLSVTAVHVLSAPVGWLVGVVGLQRTRRPRAVLFGLIVVPLTAVMTFGVMLSDAPVWRGELGDWIGPMSLALAGPATLVLLLVMALRAEGGR